MNHLGVVGGVPLKQCRSRNLGLVRFANTVKIYLESIAHWQCLHMHINRNMIFKNLYDQNQSFSIFRSM